MTRSDSGGHERVMLATAISEMTSDAGGNPIIVSTGSDYEYLAGMASGWIISGGDDFPADTLGEQQHPESRPANPKRFGIEDSLWAIFARTQKPILGICFGCQFMALRSGGKIHQHLPDAVGHDRHTKGTERVAIESDTRLGDAIGPGPHSVHTAHHQAISEQPDGWRVTAFAEDGTIEAIEEEADRWRVGVQWHPERTRGEGHACRLFKAFVEACSAASQR